jgi:hypothetical protein
MGGNCGLLREDQLVVLQSFNTHYEGKRTCILSIRAQSRTQK